MPTRVDHVIAAASDLPPLEAAFSRLGFHITGGGTHPHLGTRNRITVLGNGYLELLGIADAERASPMLTRRLASSGSGWVGFALQSGDIAAVTLAVPSLAEARATFAQVYTLNSKSTPHTDEALGALVQALPLPAGGEYIELANPPQFPALSSSASPSRARESARWQSRSPHSPTRTHSCVSAVSSASSQPARSGWLRRTCSKSGCGSSRVTS